MLSKQKLKPQISSYLNTHQMTKTQKKTANAIGGKTARPCESCLKRRAKWFCSADDAFLCHSCDSSVHSANDLAGRHHRVCLDTSKPPQPPPTWHHGFTKKARTPRKHSHKYSSQMMPVVPEVGIDDEYEDQMVEEDQKNNQDSSIIDDHMVFSVPNLDDNHPFENNSIGVSTNYDGELFNFSLIGGDDDDHGHQWEFPAEEMAEFAADVESLLEQEEEEEGVAKENDLHLHLHENNCFTEVKHEQEGEMISSTTNDHCFFDWSIDVESEVLNFDLNNYGEYCGGNDDDHIHQSHEVIRVAEEEEGNSRNNIMVPKDEVEGSYYNDNNVDDGIQAHKKRRIMLRLNYEEVINAWVSQGCSSPWTTGCRPEFDLDHHGWPYCMGDFYSIIGVDQRGNVNGGDGGREARVSRYREKRRTRLFSKKIRYEVRKLNAEKRPRLKGRFVKRTSDPFHK